MQENKESRNKQQMVKGKREKGKGKKEKRCGRLGLVVKAVVAGRVAGGRRQGKVTWWESVKMRKMRKGRKGRKGRKSRLYFSLDQSGLGKGQMPNKKRQRRSHANANA